MIILKNQEEIKKMAEGGKILSYLLFLLKKKTKPGLKTIELDKLTRAFLKKRKAHPSFLGFQGYTAALCVSLNDEIVHGIPSTKKVIKEGDLITLDAGVLYQGYHTDAAITFGAGPIKPKHQKMIQVGRETLDLAVDFIRTSKTLGDLGYFISQQIKKNGFQPIVDLAGHGIGQQLHEAPQVNNYGFPREGENFKNGMTVAIEPMLVEYSNRIKTGADGWTIKTQDKGAAVHFEQTIAVWSGKTEVLTVLD